MVNDDGRVRWRVKTPAGIDSKTAFPGLIAAPTLAVYDDTVNLVGGGRIAHPCHS